MQKVGKPGDGKLSGALQSSAKLVSPNSKRPTTAINRASSSSPLSLFHSEAINGVDSSNTILKENSADGASLPSRPLTRSTSEKAAKLPSLSIKLPVATTSRNKNHLPSNSSMLSLSMNKNESPFNSPSVFPNQSLKTVSPKDLKSSLRPTTAGTASTAASTDFESPTARPSRRSQRSTRARSLSPTALNW
jgi:hypothetical protein